MEFDIKASGNLVIFMDEEKKDKELIENIFTEMKNNHSIKNVDDFFFSRIIENDNWNRNGRLWVIQPEDVGVLTNSVMFSDEVSYEDDGTVNVTGNIYWHPNYVVSDLAETLLCNGSIVFEKAPEFKSSNEIASAFGHALDINTLNAIYKAVDGHVFRSLCNESFVNDITGDCFDSYEDAQIDLVATSVDKILEYSAVSMKEFIDLSPKIRDKIISNYTEFKTKQKEEFENETQPFKF